MGTVVVAFTPFELQVALQSETLTLLGWPTNGYDLVRVDWPTQGQPAWKITDDRVFVRAVQEDSDYDKIRDMKALDNYDDVSIQFETSYVRVWRIYWLLVGPNSFDNARILKSGLYSSASHDRLAKQNLYAVTDFSAPRRVPELFSAQWWERVDFDACFNELVTERTLVPSVGSVEIKVEKENGLSIDFTVTRSEP